MVKLNFGSDLLLQKLRFGSAQLFAGADEQFLTAGQTFLQYLGTLALQGVDGGPRHYLRQLQVGLGYRLSDTCIEARLLARHVLSSRTVPRPKRVFNPSRVVINCGRLALTFAAASAAGAKSPSCWPVLG
jgi:hypothetical protein